MPKPKPDNYETYDALTIDDDGNLAALAAQPLSDKPGFDGYVVPWYVLSDRGTFFVPGSGKKTAKERMKLAPHLWMHEDWSQPIGKHIAAFEDEKGFRISVELNEAIPNAAQMVLTMTAAPVT